METIRKEPATIQYYDNSDLQLISDFAERCLYEPFDKEDAYYDLDTLEDAVAKRLGIGERNREEGQPSFLDRFDLKDEAVHILMENSMRHILSCDFLELDEQDQKAMEGAIEKYSYGPFSGRSLPFDIQDLEDTVLDELTDTKTSFLSCLDLRQDSTREIVKDELENLIETDSQLFQDEARFRDDQFEEDMQNQYGLFEEPEMYLGLAKNLGWQKTEGQKLKKINNGKDFLDLFEHTGPYHVVIKKTEGEPCIRAYCGTHDTIGLDESFVLIPQRWLSKAMQNAELRPQIQQLMDQSFRSDQEPYTGETVSLEDLVYKMAPELYAKDPAARAMRDAVTVYMMNSQANVEEERNLAKTILTFDGDAFLQHCVEKCHVDPKDCTTEEDKAYYRAELFRTCQEEASSNYIDHMPGKDIPVSSKAITAVQHVLATKDETKIGPMMEKLLSKGRNEELSRLLQEEKKVRKTAAASR